MEGSITSTLHFFASGSSSVKENGKNNKLKLMIFHPVRNETHGNKEIGVEMCVYDE
jgi:hypothetical protein